MNKENEKEYREMVRDDLGSPTSKMDLEINDSEETVLVSTPEGEEEEEPEFSQSYSFQLRMLMKRKLKRKVDESCKSQDVHWPQHVQVLSS